jgi:hypothetical protein
VRHGNEVVAFQDLQNIFDSFLASGVLVCLVERYKHEDYDFDEELSRA